MKIEIELSERQLKAVNAVGNRLRTKSPGETLVLLGFAQMLADFGGGGAEQFSLTISDVAIPVLHGELPAFPDGKICGFIPLNIQSKVRHAR